MTEKRDLKSCLFLPCFTFIKSYSYISEIDNEIYCTHKSIFFCHFNKKRTKTKSCLYIYDPISSDGPANSLKLSSVLY